MKKDYEEFLEINDESAIEKFKQLAMLEKTFTGYEGSLESLMKIINKVFIHIYIICIIYYKK